MNNSMKDSVWCVTHIGETANRKGAKMFKGLKVLLEPLEPLGGSIDL